MPNDKIKICILFLIVSLVVPKGILFGQEQAINGKIIDSKSGEPIPFATIRLMTGEGVFGVVSNLEGDFQIPYRYMVRIDTIKISCIGYLTKILLIKELSEAQLNVIKLKESVQQLSEVVVKAKRLGRITPLKIMKAAIANIPSNYPMSPFSYVAYYRDYQFLEKKYINLDEGIVGVFDQGFDTDDYTSTKISLYDYKRNKTFESDSTKLIAYDNGKGSKFIPGASLSPFGGNELAILRMHDAIRNYRTFSYSYVNEFRNDFIDNHYFRLVDTVYLNKIPLYHLTFRSIWSKTGNDHFAKGEIYIEHGTFAIHKFQYYVFEKRNFETKLLFNIQLEYVKSDALMHLNYISFNNVFKIKNNDFKVEDVLFDRGLNAFVITFSHKPETQSALNVHNYKFRYDHTPMKIDRVEISESDLKQVYVYMRENISGNENMKSLANKLQADFNNIKDLDGREVNVITYLTVNQFRELFVQKITSPTNTSDNLYINKNEPLTPKMVNITPGVDITNYWMNSPLKSE